MTSRPLLLVASIFLSASASAGDSNWPQFRGPDGLGIGTGKPPVEFSPDKNVLWKIPMPTGHSSPCIWADRIALTALDGGKLVTICVSRKDGRELWRATAPAEKIEETHRIGSPASSTPCTDGERLYVMFGSFGVLAYDWNGKELWRKALPAPVVEFGTGASPILADGKVIVLRDQDVGSQLIALDAATGAEAWRTERPEFRRSFSTPLLWKHDGKEEIVVAGSLWVRSYSPKDGHELWSARGMARVANATPVAGDGLLFVSSWNVGGDEDARLAMATFADFAAENDANKDGVLVIDEFPKGPFRDRFSQIDVNKDGKVTAEEYEHMRDMFASAENQLFAIRPGGNGDISTSHVSWFVKKHLPYVSSPLFYEGRIFTMKNGGLASCYEAKTGETLYQAQRVDVPGDYYSSPVAADGRIYVTSQRGTVVVLEAGSTFRVLARNALGEPVFATPAICDGRVFLRTEKTLFAFGE